jgi:hypothetical protein
MVKPVYKFLIIIAVVCLSVFFTILALSVVSQENFDEAVEAVVFSEADFPLEVDLQKTVFSVGDRFSCNATITNRCGRDVFVVSDGYEPGWFFYGINESRDYDGSYLSWDGRTLKVNDTMLTVVDFTITQPPGTYVFALVYKLEVEGVVLRDELETIIEVKG